MSTFSLSVIKWQVLAKDSSHVHLMFLCVCIHMGRNTVSVLSCSLKTAKYKAKEVVLSKPRLNAGSNHDCRPRVTLQQQPRNAQFHVLSNFLNCVSVLLKDYLQMLLTIACMLLRSTKRTGQFLGCCSSRTVKIMCYFTWCLLIYLGHLHYSSRQHNQTV